MPGGEKLQYPFPYKNGSGLGGDEGDLEVDNLIVNEDAIVVGDLTVGGTITGDFVGDFTGPYYTATDDDNQWRTTSSSGTTAFVAENQVNPTYNFKNQAGIVANSVLSAGRVVLNDSSGNYVFMDTNASMGRIRTSADAFGLDIETSANKLLKLAAGTISLNTINSDLTYKENVVVASDSVTFNETTKILGSTTEFEFAGLGFNVACETSFDVAATLNASIEAVAAASITAQKSVSISAHLPLVPINPFGTVSIMSDNATSIEATELDLTLANGIKSTGELSINTGLGSDLDIVSGSALNLTANVDNNIVLTANQVTSTAPIRITDTTNSTVIDTGALIVEGGVGIFKDVWIGGTLNAVSLAISGETNLDTLIVNSITNATSASTGCGVFKGGVGVGNNLYVGGFFYALNNATVTGTTLTNKAAVTSTDNATDITDGALTVAGGASIVKDLYVGNNIDAANALGANSLAVFGNTVSISPDSGAAIIVGGVGIGGDVHIAKSLFAHDLTVTGDTGTGTLRVNSGTNSGDPFSGAATIGGGLGVADDVWIGGGLNVIGTIHALGTVDIDGVLNANDIKCFTIEAIPGTGGGSSTIQAGEGQIVYIGGGNTGGVQIDAKGITQLWGAEIDISARGPLNMVSSGGDITIQTISPHIGTVNIGGITSTATINSKCSGIQTIYGGGGVTIDCAGGAINITQPTVGAINIENTLGDINVACPAGVISFEVGVGGFDVTAGASEIAFTTGVGAFLVTTGVGGVAINTGAGGIELGAGAGGIVISTDIGAILIESTAGVITIGSAGGVVIGALGVTSIGGVGVLNLGGAGEMNVLSAIFTAETGDVTWTTPLFTIIGDLAVAAFESAAATIGILTSTTINNAGVLTSLSIDSTTITNAGAITTLSLDSTTITNAGTTTTSTLDSITINNTGTISTTDLITATLEVTTSISTPQLFATGENVNSTTNNIIGASMGNINSNGDIMITGFSGLPNTQGMLIFAPPAIPPIPPFPPTTNQFTNLRGFPTFTARSQGTRIVLNPSISSASVDNAIGLGPSSQWYSVTTTIATHDFYHGTFWSTSVRSTGVVVVASTQIPPTSNTFTNASASIVSNGDILLNGTDPTLVFSGVNGYGPPGYTSRSTGSRIVIDPLVSSASADAAIGLEVGFMWYSVTDSTQGHKFYGGNVLQMQIGTNNVNVPSTAASTSITTGSFTTAGGIGAALNSYFGAHVVLQDTTSIGNSNSVGQTSGTLNIGGDLAMYNSTSIARLIVWTAPAVQGPPTFTTRSPGTRIIFSPRLSATQTDYAIGLSSTAQWYSVAATFINHEFYCATTLVATIGNTAVTLVPSTNSTSISTGALITPGGVGIGKDVFIGGLISVATSAAIGTALNVGTTLSVTGQSFFVNATTIGNSNTINATSGAINVNGSISMYGNNEIVWPASTVGVPTTTTRSAGTRLVVYPNLSSSTTDYAIGAASSIMWYSTDQANSYHVFYCGTSQAMSLNMTAMTVQPTTNSISTATGALIVLGGAGIAKAIWGGDIFASSSTNFGAPTFTTSSAGSRYILYQATTATTADFALGITTSSLWYSTSRTTDNHLFYSATTLAATLNATTGLLLASSAASTSTSTGSFVTPGGIGAGGNMFIGGTTSSAGTMTVNDTTSIGSVNVVTSTSGSLNVGGDLVMFNHPAAVARLLMWPSLQSPQAPTFTTRSFGTRIVLSASLSATAVDFALGVNTFMMWYSVPTAASVHNFFCGITNVASIGATSLLLTPTTNTTSSITGAIITPGGIGMAKDIFVGGLANIASVLQLSPTSNSPAASLGALNVAGDLLLLNPTAPMIVYTNVGVNAPAFTTRSTGTKIVLSPLISGTTVDNAIGVNINTVWYSAAATTSFHAFYVAATPIVTIGGAGLTCQSTFNATSATTGAIISDGGIGVVKDIFVGGLTNIASVLQLSPTSNSPAASLGALNVAGDLLLLNPTAPMIVYNNIGVNAPAFTTRSTGTKIVLSPLISGTTVDNAIGVNTNTVWYSAAASTSFHAFYVAATPIVTIGGAGLTCQSTFNSTSVTTGAIISDGGLGVVKDFFLGGLMNVTGTTTLNNTLNVTAASTLTSLTTTGQNFLQIGTKIGSSAPSSTNAGLNVNGDISLYNTTSNMIAFSPNGVATPTTSTRSLGTKLLLNPSLTGSLTDFAIGIQSDGIWYSVDQGAHYHVWYAGSSQVMSVNNAVLSVKATTNATSTTVGAINTPGGISCAQDGWIGGNLHVTGSLTFGAGAFSYSEGTYTPIIYCSSASVSMGGGFAKYIKMGRNVNVYFQIFFSYSSVTSSTLLYMGLPFQVDSQFRSTCVLDQTTTLSGSSGPFYVQLSAVVYSSGIYSSPLLNSSLSGISAVFGGASGQIVTGSLTYVST